MLRHVYRTKFLTNPNVRTFLSDAYKCTEAWQARLNAAVLKQVNTTSFYHDLDRKFNQHGQVCAVDIDIFANKLNDNTYLEELADIVHKLRLTAETTNVLDSTSHAVIRHHLDFGNDNITNLINILDDRLSYGIFLDSYTTNLLLDRLLKLKNYRLAAKVASLLMLQEDFENDISRTLSLYACYKYLEHPEPFEEVVKPDADITEKQETKPMDAKAMRKARKKPEEIKIRVKFIRNEYFDDHFDLRNSHHLVGKTFLVLSRYIDGMLGNTLKLLGYCYYEKYEDGCKFIESLGEPKELYKDAIDSIQKHLATVTDKAGDEQFKQFVEQVTRLTQSTLAPNAENNLEEVIQKLATDTVAQYESSEIEEQKKIYDLWCKIRETRLNEELDRVNRFRRLQEIERITAEMSEQEERLWFFDNEQDIDLEIDNLDRKGAYPKERRTIKKVRTKVIDESYIPPEVGVKHN